MLALTLIAECYSSRAELGFDLDYIGLWNEREWGTTSYVLGLRNSLDAAGFTNTQIIIPDGYDYPSAVAAMEANATFAAALSGVGLHYPCNSPDPIVENGLGKKFWASEDFSTVSDQAGAECWGRMLVDNYVRMNMTSTISWSLVWGVYGNLPYFGNGLIYASEPWSGSYGIQASDGSMQINGATWTSAHFTQFTDVGWRFLHVPGGGSGHLPGGGSYVTLVPADDLSQMTVILHTLQGDCLRCKGYATTAQTITFQTANGLPGPGTVLQVWQTTATDQFIKMAPITIAADSTFTVSIPADAMVTVTTRTNGGKGNPGPIPPSAPFPLPYNDDFSTTTYAYDAMAKYFADQGGSFAVRNGSLTQVVPIDPGPNGWVGNPDPVSLIGDYNWSDYTVAATASFSSSVSSGMGSGDDGNAPAALSTCDSSSVFQQWSFNSPAQGYLSNSPAHQQPMCLNSDGCGSSLIYYQCVTSGGTCCGATCYAGLQFSLNANGSLTTPLNGQCVSVAPAGNITLAPCGSVGNQSWSYSSSSKQLQLQGSNLCLTAPVSLTTYVSVCGRYASFNGFTKAAQPGYCLLVSADGTWEGKAAANVLAKGTLASFDSTQWHALALTMNGTTISGSVNGTQLFAVQDSSYARGMAAVGSGYHTAMFDTFSLTPA